MEEAPLLGAMPSPEDEMVTDLFSPEGQFVPPAPVKHEEDEFHVFRDAYLSATEPQGPPLRALSPTLGADCPAKLLGERPGLPDLHALEDAAPLAAAQPHAYNVHFLSSLLASHRSPAVVPLGAWARDGAAHPGVRVIPVRASGTGTAPSPGGPSQKPLGPEAWLKFPSSPGNKKNPPLMCSSFQVVCQLKGGTQVLCIDNPGTRELKALHLLPQYQDQSSHLQPDGPKPMTTFVGRFLPVPAKLNLIAQQVDNGALPAVLNGPAFPSSSTLPGPPKIALSG
uniref:Testis expressed metallothionein like protein n=1 Tax=Oryctolagus cuniculus TaxID=9986 RepID=A0A5F9CA50_RABIT